MALVSSTFVGGVGTDICTGIAIDAGQNMLIAGSTDSADFPLVNPIAGQTRGGNEAFVAKLNADGTALVFSTTLGGTGTDAAQTVSVDSSDNVYVAGYTSSFNFPLKPLLPPPAGYDAFLCRLSSTGSLSYARLLGGRGDDIASAVSVDGSGTAVIAGYTTSLDLPITDGWQSDSKGNFEAFAAGFDSAGKTVFSSYLGGSGDDRAYAVHSAGGDVTVVGITSSSDLSVRSAVQPARAPSYDSFLAVFTLARAVTAARRSLYTQSTTLREVGRWDLQGDTGVTLDPSVVLAASGSADWSVVAVADVNRDGTPDLVWQHASLGYAQAWLMGGASGSNIIGAIVLNDRVVSGWNIVAALDLNRDGFTDLIWQNSSGIAQVWYLGGASRAQITGAALLNGGATTWKIVAAGDLNKDGVPDLIWQAPGGIAQVWYMGGTDGSKIIGAAMISSIEVPNWRIAALADMNSDGQNDVIWQQDSGVVQVWHMGGTSGSTVTAYRGAAVAAVSDFGPFNTLAVTAHALYLLRDVGFRVDPFLGLLVAIQRPGRRFDFLLAAQ